MKRCTVLVLIVCLIGCTTLQPVTGNPAAVQQRIAAGGLLKRGDHIVVLTKDGRTHELNVTSVSVSTIEGRHESLSIDQIVAIQERKLSVEKTALALGLTVVAAAVVVAVCLAGGYRSSAGRASGRSARFAHPLSPPPLLLPTPSQNSQLQRCGPSGESQGREDGAASAPLLRCGT